VESSYQQIDTDNSTFVYFFMRVIGLTKKAEPPPTRDVNRDSGTASANGVGSGDLLGIIIVNVLSQSNELHITQSGMPRNTERRPQPQMATYCYS
jgi:hypothetical protein